MAAQGWMARVTALIGVGTLGLHEASYALAGRSGSAGSGAHSYLIAVAPLLTVGTLLALAALLRRAAHGASAPAPRLARLWPGATAALLATYGAQEMLEGAAAGHHSGGIAALVDHGGWVAVPLALAIGFAIAAVTRWTTAAAADLARPRRPWRAPLPATPPPCHSVRAVASAARAGAERAHGARGPPLLSP